MKSTLETRLGIFFALALVVAIIILEMVGAADFFKPGRYEVRSSFKNVQELKRGDPAKMAGVQIGRVEDIKLVGERAMVVMKIDGKYNIRSDAKATVRFTGLMGQNYIAIEDGSSPVMVVHAKTDGAILQSEEQPDLGAIMAKLNNVATGVEGLTKSFSSENFSTLLGPVLDVFTQNRTNINEIMTNVRTVTDDVAKGRGSIGMLLKDPAFYNAAYQAVTNIQAVSGDLKGLANQANGMMGQVGGLIGQTRVIVDQVQAGEGTLGKFVKDPTPFNQITNVLGNAAEIMAKMNSGTGTVAKIINDQELYRNAKLSVQKLEKMSEGLEDQGPLSVLGILVNTLF